MWQKSCVPRDLSCFSGVFDSGQGIKENAV